MKDDFFSSFKTQFEMLQNSTNSIRERAEAILSEIREERFISAETATLLSDTLASYKSELLEFKAAGEKLAIDIEAGISSVRDAIVEHENLQKMIAERQLVLDYLRLNTLAENTVKQLEESKMLLLEKCQGENIREELHPYDLVVQNVRAGKTGLPDDVFDIIENEIGKKIARATDRGELLIDEAAEIAQYLDGSCELLAPLDTVMPAPGMESAPVSDASNESVSADEEPPRDKNEETCSGQQKHFDGCCNTAALAIPDIPSIRFNSKEFTETGILPKSFLPVGGNPSPLFLLRLRLIKQFIRNAVIREQGLNLFCIEQNTDMPIACWADSTQAADGVAAVHYLVPGIFESETVRGDITDIRNLIDNSAPAQIVVVSVSDEDKEAVQRMLGLNDGERAEFAVLENNKYISEAELTEDLPTEISSTETNEDDVYVPALNKIKDAKPSAAAFLSDIEKTNHPRIAGEIVILISYFGVVSQDVLVYFSDLIYGTYHDRDAIIGEVLKQLVNKGILSSYRGAESQVLYCFTQYAYTCIHKDSVAQNFKRRINQRIGNCKYIGKAEMRLSELLQIEARAAGLYCFLCCAQSYFDSQTNSKIISSIASAEECAISLNLPYQNEMVRFRAVAPNEILPDTNQLILAVPHDIIEDDWNPDISGGALLLFKDSDTYEWNGHTWDLLYAFGDDSAESADDEFGQPEETAEGNLTTKEESDITAEPPFAQGFETEAENASSGTATAESEKISLHALLTEMVQSGVPTDLQFTEAIERLISEQSIEDAGRNNYHSLANALMLAKGASIVNDCPLTNDLYQKLLAATNIPLDDFEYTGEYLSSLFAADSRGDESLKLAAYSHAMFAPQPYDYTLNGVCDQFIQDFDHLFPSYPRYKGLFIKLNDIRSLVPEGFSNRVLGLLGDQAERQAHSNAISKKAAELCEVPATNTGNLPGHQETLFDCFGPDSDIGLCMKAISENRISDHGFVEEVYQTYCKENGKVIQSRIDDVVEEIWRRHRTHKGNLVSKGKVQVDNAYRARLELMKEWLDSDCDTSHFDAKAIRARSAELIKEIDRELSSLKKVEQQAQPAILYWALQGIKAKLELKNSLSMISFFSGILFSGIISMADNGLPMLDQEMNGVKFYEPWRNAVRSILTPYADADTVKNRIIYESDSAIYDNYRQLRMLGQYLGSDSDEYSVDSEDLQRATRTADAAEREFRQKLEYAYTYDRIGEPEKERLAALLDYKGLFYTREDFACWRGYLDALNMQLNELSEEHRVSLKKRLEGAKASLPDREKCTLLEEAEKMLKEQNYAVTEEYLNRFDAGERELSAETNLLRNEERTFEEFISPEVYNPIFAACSKKAGKNTNFRGFATSYIVSKFPKEWTSRYKDDARDFVNNWPVAKDNTSADNIAVLLRLLGLDVTNVDKVKYSVKVQHFKASVRSTPRNKPDYQHPISAFGTQTRNPVNILVLYGKNDPAEIVTKVNNMNLGNNTIVFIDYPLALADRRAVAEYFHKSTSGQNTFLLIDQVLAVFLALKSTNERLPAFLKCTLPFTRYQPFVYDGGPTADDMFCGRVSELQKILDPQGACVVYGGRQLGKTALLQRAESLRSKPDDLHYAVYTSIFKLTGEKEVVERIVEDINKKTHLRLKDAESIRDVAAQLTAKFREGAVRTLLLLIDEADSFLENISKDMYRQLQPLVDLKRDMHNDFKFVLAGLHNVYRAKNATDKNGVFGQLGMPLCIKPLSPTDALQLISRPLMYLGFQVDRYPHLETILTNTNYYPGILQFFGYNLVQSVPAQYGEYFSAKNGNPPFSLEEKQLSAIMTSNDLNNSIKEKFRLSLKLDTRYFMLARVIALLYFENDAPETSRDGFTAVHILDYAKELGIHCLENADYSSAEILLDEMVEMGILNRVEITKGYCLRRRSFLNIIGANADSLLDEIVMENKETE